MEAHSETTCCIVGGGPAGMVLGLLLARQGIDVTLLESHKDFDRDFRGDTLHASSMEIMEQLGLEDQVLKLANSKISELRIRTDRESILVANFVHVKTKFPYVAMVPQENFLNLLATEAKKYSNFHLQMNARAHDLIVEDGNVRGVLYSQDGQTKKLMATLTIGADGRSSQIRKQSGLKIKHNAPPMDVLWFTLERRTDDSQKDNVLFRIHGGRLLIMIDRGDHYQVGYVILKGDLKKLRDKGIDALKQEIKKLTVPTLHDRIDALNDWSQVATLIVQAGRVTKWYLPGLLLIGDAAHIMSPVGGVGINYAIQDAVAASNLLSVHLKNNHLTENHLAAVQKRREWPTRFIQRFQSIMQKRLVAAALKENNDFRLPWIARVGTRLPLIRTMAARTVAYGLRRERISHPIL